MSFTDRPAGTMTYHPTHGHQHVDDWGIYTLRTDNGDPNPVNWPIIGTGSKLGFCLLDIGSCNSSPGYCTDALGNTLNSTNIVNYGLGGGSYSCSNTVQGITNGYMDTYSQGLDGMWIVIPPGTCNGQYYVVVQIDPLNYFRETNENNNVVAVPITLTQQSSAPVISVTGSLNICPSGSVTLTASAASNYTWSTGETNQSIIVTTAGSYTVSTTCGSTNATSNPVVVTNGAVAPTISATGAPNLCPGGTVTLNASSSLNYLCQQEPPHNQLLFQLPTAIPFLLPAAQTLPLPHLSLFLIRRLWYQLLQVHRTAATEIRCNLLPPLLLLKIFRSRSVTILRYQFLIIQ